MATDLEPTIVQAALEPASASADGQSATGRSIADLIAADQYLAGKVAAKQKRRGLTFSKIVPAGAISDDGTTLGGSAFGGGLS